jgi:hypothetical protein
VALVFAEVLPRHSVRAPLLARLLSGLLAGAALKAAAESLHAVFAIETFYRLRQRLRRQLDQVRACLHGERTAPVSQQSDPLLQTVEHLRGLFPEASDPVTAFQLHFQRPLLGGRSLPGTGPPTELQRQAPAVGFSQVDDNATFQSASAAAGPQGAWR